MLTWISKFLPSKIRIIAFFSFLFTIIKGIWFVIKLLKAKTAGVLSGLADTIKEVGISKILAYYFILGFVFKGLYAFLFVNHNLLLLFSKVGLVLVTAENDIINQITFLKTINEVGIYNILSVLHVYISILGAIFIFKYLLELLVGGITKLFSNESLGGIGPYVVAIIILMFLEIFGLMVISVTSGGVMKMGDVTPFLGFWELGTNFNEIIHPFGGKNITVIDAVDLSNLTINDVFNQTEEIDTSEGFKELVLKRIIGVVGKIF